MGSNEATIAMLGILCGTGLSAMFLYTLKAIFTRRALPKQDDLLAEMRALREEMRQLRQQNNDVVLSMDTSVHRLEHRLERIEHRMLPGTTASEPTSQPLGRAR